MSETDDADATWRQLEGEADRLAKDVVIPDLESQLHAAVKLLRRAYDDGDVPSESNMLAIEAFIAEYEKTHPEA